MWYKPYGKTGKEVSAISFGGMRFADPQDIDGSAEVVMHAYRKGVNYFDTAPGYCADKSEEIMGAAFAQMKPGTFYSSSKCMSPDGDTLRSSLERTLKRLGLERITFFHIWCLVKPEQWQQRKDGGAVKALLKAKEEGLVEHVVVSSHLPGEQLSSVLEEGCFEGVTLGYCAINFPFREHAIRTAGRLGLGVATMNPLGGGLIPQFPERFDFIKGQADKSVVAAALRFNVSQPEISTALVGFTTTDHVDQACAAVENFKPYDTEHVQAVRDRIGESFDGFCTGCGYCLPCPKGINIPAMMDAYNHRMLQGDDPKHVLNRLKWHWSESADQAAECIACGQCEARCTQHLPIADRMKEIAEIAQTQEE